MISQGLRSRLFFHSPLGFLRGKEEALADSLWEGLKNGVSTGRMERCGDVARLWLQKLEWDSNYFGCPTYRIEFADWDDDLPDPAATLAQTLSDLRRSLAARHGRYYLFFEVPSEDVTSVQALGLAGLRLIETRLTYYHDDLGRFDSQPPVAARAATVTDIAGLRDTAIEARNDYDRYHADPFFSQAVADQYLAEYVEQCVRGFTDVVLVPNDDRAAGAFVCGKANIAAPELRVGRLVLAAVSDARRGWYRSLNEALLRWMKDQGMTLVVNTTQSTNRAVIHVSTQLGYRFGRAAHLFAGHD